nr:hypothetical protein [Fodinicola acaciae]
MFVSELVSGRGDDPAIERHAVAAADRYRERSSADWQRDAGENGNWQMRGGEHPQPPQRQADYAQDEELAGAEAEHQGVWPVDVGR